MPASFQGNCLRIAQNCVSGLFRCQNVLWTAVKIGYPENNNKRKLCLNLVCPINVQTFSSLGWHIFMGLIQILLKRHTQYMQYLLDLLGIKSSGFLGIFVVWIKALERHDIGKRSRFRISVLIKISIWALPIYSVTTVIREKSPERSNVSSEQMVLTSIPTVLFKLPALAMAHLKLILEQSYKKKQKKRKGVEKLWN